MDNHIWKGPYRACKACGAADRYSSGDCRPCSVARERRYREAHPDKVRESDRKRREANRENLRESNRKYREAHPEKVRESNRKHREVNREKVRESNRKRQGMVNPHGKRSIGAPCPICQEIMTEKGKHKASLDHNHITEIVREEICNFCNLTLGMLGADRGLEAVALSEAFTAYLRKHTLSYAQRLLIMLSAKTS